MAKIAIFLTPTLYVYAQDKKKLRLQLPTAGSYGEFVEYRDLQIAPDQWQTEMRVKPKARKKIGNLYPFMRVHSSLRCGYRNLVITPARTIERENVYIEVYNCALSPSLKDEGFTMTRATASFERAGMLCAEERAIHRREPSSTRTFDSFRRACKMFEENMPDELREFQRKPARLKSIPELMRLLSAQAFWDADVVESIAKQVIAGNWNQTGSDVQLVLIRGRDNLSKDHYRGEDIIHFTNLALARISLANEKLTVAENYLLAAAQLKQPRNIHEVDFSVARLLLQRGRLETVRKYLESTNRFVQSFEDDPRPTWILQLSKGRAPEMTLASE